MDGTINKKTFIFLQDLASMVLVSSRFVIQAFVRGCYQLQVCIKIYRNRIKWSRLIFSKSSIRTTELSSAENNGVGNSFGLHLWGLKAKKFRFLDFRHLMRHRRKGLLYVRENYAIAWGRSYCVSH